MDSRDNKRTPSGSNRKGSGGSARKGKSSTAGHKGKGLQAKSSRQEGEGKDMSQRSVVDYSSRPGLRSNGPRTNVPIDSSRELQRPSTLVSGRASRTPSASAGYTRSDRSGSPSGGLSDVRHKKTPRPVNYARINELAEPKGGRRSTGVSARTPVVPAGNSNSYPVDRVVIRREELGLRNLREGSERRQRLMTDDVGGLDDQEHSDAAESRSHMPKSRSSEDVVAAVTLARMSSGSEGFRAETTGSYSSQNKTPTSRRNVTSGQDLGKRPSPPAKTDKSASTRLLPKRPRIGEASGSSRPVYQEHQSSVRENPYRQPALGLSRSSVGRGTRGVSSRPSGPVGGRPGTNQSRALSVTVKELKAMRDDQPITRPVKVLVVRLQSALMRNPLVHKNRRLMAIADCTGSMMVHIKRSLPIKFIEGQCILLCNVRVRQGLLTVHDKTTITRVGDVGVSHDIQEAASSMYDRPMHAPSSIANIVAQGPGHSVSLVARVVQSEDSRLIIDREKKQKYVKEITLQQDSTTIKMSLWDAAAAYAEFTVGDTVEVHDVSTVWSNHHRAAALTCNFSDQIVVLPASDLEEEIIILGLEESHNLDDLECTVEINNTIAHYVVNRYQLTNRLNTAEDQSVEDLVSFLPITGVAVISGQNIAELEVHSFRERMVFRNAENDVPFAAQASGNAEDIFAEGRDIFTDAGSAEIHPPVEVEDNGDSDDAFSVEQAIYNENSDVSDGEEETLMDMSDDSASSLGSVPEGLLDSDGELSTGADGAPSSVSTRLAAPSAAAAVADNVLPGTHASGETESSAQGQEVVTDNVRVAVTSHEMIFTDGSTRVLQVTVGDENGESSMISLPAATGTPLEMSYREENQSESVVVIDDSSATTSVGADR